MQKCYPLPPADTVIATDDPEMTSPVDRESLTVTVTEADYPEMERSQHGSMVSADISEIEFHRLSLLLQPMFWMRGGHQLTKYRTK